jgi:hypothetical protein
MSETEKTADVRIMLLVGSNGKTMACVEDHMGWGDLEDGIAGWVGSKCIDPDASARFIITAQVPVPNQKAPEIAGKAEEVTF